MCRHARTPVEWHILAPTGLADYAALVRRSREGVALIVGVGILWSNRSRMEEEQGVTPTFYDWFLIWEIMAVGVTGLLAELSRLVGVAVPAYLFYYLHLVAVMMLFLYMPYTKFAHMVYRTVGMAFEKYRESGFIALKEE